MAVGSAMLGCGEIIEVPVAMTSETEQTDSGMSGPESTEGPGTTGADPTGHDTNTPDIDDASTSGSADDAASSTADRPLELVPFCLQPEDVPEIPEDGSWHASMMTVQSLEGVVSLQVGLRISHPRVSDLQVRLRSPDGETVELLMNPACSAANVSATFEDHAQELGNDQCLTDVAAIMGSVKALDEVDRLLRDSVEGAWTLELTDTEPEEAGWLDGVCIVLVVEGD